MCSVFMLKAGLQVIKETLNPIWNETLVFTGAEVKQLQPDAPLVAIEVWDADTLTDDFLGQVGAGCCPAAAHALLFLWAPSQRMAQRAETAHACTG